ncbi:hypothetical protein PR048_013142 [Dryococelus australis]|uniref:Uncharacterized protein n=1 Tax=Dryococelus australis TaxID=614101 RepID=A0ABQ9HSU8_9NEOP|nr:hypothetical protein PR048_013142 [Dryococelus australis]
MESFKPLSPLILDGNLCENFRKVKQNFEIFMLAKVLYQNSLKRRQTGLQKVLQAFADYCDPVKNIVVERFKFHSRLQEEGESCEFKDLADSVVQDRIVLGIQDKGLQECLL